MQAVSRGTWTRCRSRSIFLAERIKEFGCDLEHEPTFNFLAEYCQLFTSSPNRRRYSMETLIFSFTYFHNSNACYSKSPKMFCVPSKRTLRRISSNLSVHSGMQCQTYIKQKITLKPYELLVNLMLDEIHIKQKYLISVEKLLALQITTLKQQLIRSKLSWSLLCSPKIRMLFL